MRSGSSGRRALIATAGITVTALTLAACGGGGNSGGGSSAGGALTIGTTDKITSIDPAGSYDNGSVPLVEPGLPVPEKNPLRRPGRQPGNPRSGPVPPAPPETGETQTGPKGGH